MKPATEKQEMMYALHRNNCDEKNAINVALWYERRKTHFMALKIMRDYFRGINHGRT